MALTTEDKNWISAQIAAQVAEIWAYRVEVTDSGDQQPAAGVLGDCRHQHDQILDRVSAVSAQVSELTTMVEDLEKGIVPPAVIPGQAAWTR